MKLFRQKDELFEIMARGAGERRRVNGGGEPTPTPVPAPTSASTPASTPTSTPASTPTASTVAAEPSTTSAPEPITPPPTLKPVGTPVSGRTGSTALLPRPSGSPGPAPAFKSVTSRTSGRPSAVPPPGVTTRRVPKPARPVLGGDDDDLLDIDGDALVVVEDGWEEESAAIAAASGGRLFALRTDTAVVGGLLGAGLLVTAFLWGRTTTDPTPPAERPIVVITEPAPPSNAATTVTPSAPNGGATTLPASAPSSRSPADASSSAPQAGFSPRQASTSPSPAPAPAPVSPGKYEVRVCSTTPEKAQALAQWLNTNPRSPIFGRGDLQATVHGGSVKIQGFAQREGDVFARVRATSDPTGGNGTFNDAYWATVR